MPEAARLSDITTEPGCDVASLNFLEKERRLDGLEYHMGLSRGDLEESSPMTTIELHRDMVQLFKSRSWGLLPPLDILQKIYDLYDYNQKKSTPTAGRTLFSGTLPHKEYEYELLPVATPDKLPIYVGEVRHDYPYPNLPRVKTTIHPCFAIRSVFFYSLKNLNYAPNSLVNDNSPLGLISTIDITSALCVNLSWLHGTWYDYPNRPIPTARPDPRPKLKPPPPVDDSDEEDYATPPRDLSDPRILIGQKRMQAYMEKHNRRYQDETNDEGKDDDSSEDDDASEDDDDDEDGYATPPRDVNDPRILARRKKMEAYMAKHNRRYQDELKDAEGEDDQSTTPVQVGKRTRSGSTSQASADVQSATLRRSKRLQELDTSKQSAGASKKRARFKDSVGGPSKRQRSNKREADKKRPPTRGSHAVDDSPPPSPAVRRSSRKRKIVSR